MTAQEPDILIVDDVKYELADTPPHNGNIHEGWSGRTSNYRGYIGVWELKDDRLYLKDTYEGGMKNPGPIFADWVSQEIKIWSGELLHYVHAGFGSMYEEDVYFTVENGVVVGGRKESNVDKFCERAKEEVRIADTKDRISFLYSVYLDPMGSFSGLVEKETPNQHIYKLLQIELEELFKDRLQELAKDPNSGIQLRFK